MPKYTVLVGAVTISTGRKNPENRKAEVVRVLKGGEIDAPADHPTILTLLSTKSIRLTSDLTGKEKITPRHIMRAFRESVTARPNRNVEAIDAPSPVTDPNELVGLD